MHYKAIAGWLTTAVAASALSVAPLSAQAAACEKQGGTLVYAVRGTPRHLNPAVQSGIATGVPGTQLFAAPLRFDENWNAQPYLAERWETSDDGLTMTLHLVKGATFHDGQPITSQDVAFSIATVKANHPFKTMFEPVAEVLTPDAHTAVLKLSKPHPALELAMSSQLLSIIPKHIYGDGHDPKKHPRNSENLVGSGAFKLVEFKRGEHIILTRNENYFLPGKPCLDKIVIRIIKDNNARIIALDKGEVHMAAFEAGPTDINRLKKNKNLEVTPRGYSAIGPINWLAFNTARKPMSDKRVRQAIAYAVDRNFITQALLRGTAEVATGPIVPGSPYYNGEVALYDVDLDKANRLLDEAGFPKGSDGTRFGLTVDYIPPVQKSLAEYLKPQLKKIGIGVTVRAAPDFPTWAKRVGGHDFDISWDIVFNWGDPVIGVHRTYLSTNIRKGVIWSNTQGYANPEVDELLDRAGRETDVEKRQALYAEFQKIVADELPVYWTHTLPYHTIYSKKLGNPPLTIWGTSSPLDSLYWK
ncbi:MAG: ABC transporter substrate-binding protein [Gammaproteobacteria bacterium]|nr:ABC transporter substrate-binding protein [Gammaproteobacteria bacterium]